MSGGSAGPGGKRQCPQHLLCRSSESASESAAQGRGPPQLEHRKASSRLPHRHCGLTPGPAWMSFSFIFTLVPIPGFWSHIFSIPHFSETIWAVFRITDTLDLRLQWPSTTSVGDQDTLWPAGEEPPL